jgi:fatty acid desaturase
MHPNPLAKPMESAPSPLISEERVIAGQWVSRRNRAQYPIPAALNLSLAGLQLCVAFLVLSLVSRTYSAILLAGLAVAFAFVMQMGFCLAHEAVHRKLHPNPRLNLSVGVLMFSLFPGSFHFFEVAHLIHHRRNRSDDELEDYVLPGETPWIKRIMYYLLIAGLFWLLLPLSSIAVAMIPSKRIRLPQPDENSGVFRKFAQFLTEVRPGRVRRDLLVAVLVWGVAFPLLHLRFLAVVLCYAAFAFSWASQQYIYHVRTPRHAVLGALDLRLWNPVRWLYLNFNYHLTHHLAAWVPWTYLPSIAAQAPSRGYLDTYVQLWQPPELLQDAWPPQYQESGPLPSRPAHKSHRNVDLPW